MSACEMLTSKSMIKFFKYSQGLNFHHLFNAVTTEFSQTVFAYPFRLKVLERMLEDVSCGYWGCGGVVIRVQGNTLSDN